ncbi:MAG TPA: hypothetical protein VLS27_12970 [Gammaproteobacteria bacterium]|nr:hypothetical protein [Gammaproteobacteria bacterium]
MSRILAFTNGPNDWRVLLADPVKHWRIGYSARTLAHCWESAVGFPPEVSAVLEKSDHPLLDDLTPVLAVPEFKVPLPGGVRSSQNDIFVLAKSRAGPISIMVEGKVDESFGPTIGAWQEDASPGKDKRLKFLLDMLGLDVIPNANVRYQLLHRAASAVVEAKRFHAVAALLLVHSFRERRAGWPDYEAFLKLFGVQAAIAKTQALPSASSLPLFSAWVPGDRSYLDR